LLILLQKGIFRICSCYSHHPSTRKWKQFPIKVPVISRLVSRSDPPTSSVLRWDNSGHSHFPPHYGLSNRKIMCNIMGRRMELCCNSDESSPTTMKWKI
jgi:hypothetical protein